ncbi:transcriptional regulator, AraC family with amidase-like domain [Pasteurella testudinis DSM 23072]|uniref:Transcriptional regulator, AraC family with amidase-like domain n=1 Tax=Pasteurella testudinis DSM 23072 TaxID=1122938 RepID=A0A1W1V6F1_9PAST|nr:helix-turn-helix domain-containing protein [Pasteurella testudinis]SMB89009.1 transcriptional regulator, AraC family with amidase-like domain [Pasteurella testudinis DSM 23072]SUB50229.1 ThiJ/PfpI family protein [Pasteurella testudinis]
MDLPKVVLYAYDRFNAFVFNAPQAIFHARYQGQKLFDVKTASLDGQAKQADVGLILPVDGGLDLLDTADMIVIAGWSDLAAVPDERLLAKLRQANAQGSQIVGLCYGTYALAYAGILDGRQAVTHWLAEQDFCRRFPQVRLDSNRLYLSDGNITTSAGAAAGLDCCLHLVRQRYGSKAANQLARTMVIPPHREGGQAQFIQQPMPKSTQDSQINQLLDYLREHLSEPHHIDALAARSHMSRSTFTRHFKHATGMSFAQWLIQARLARSQELLESSTLSVEQISAQTGFQNTAGFRQHFKQRFGVSPKQWRRVFGGE